MRSVVVVVLITQEFTIDWRLAIPFFQHQRSVADENMISILCVRSARANASSLRSSTSSMCSRTLEHSKHGWLMVIMHREWLAVPQHTFVRCVANEWTLHVLLSAVGLRWILARDEHARQITPHRQQHARWKTIYPFSFIKKLQFAFIIILSRERNYDLQTSRRVIHEKRKKEKRF